MSIYVTCTARNNGEPFNVWFAPADVKSGKKLSTPTAMSESTSRQLCYDAIKSRVNHPSTLDMHTFTGYATRVANNGNREIIQTFSAKNSFGLELKHEARCLILPDGKVEVTIQEARSENSFSNHAIASRISFGRFDVCRPRTTIPYLSL